MAVSLAVFGPQSKAPKQELLDETRSYIARHRTLSKIVDELPTLLDVWTLLLERKPELACIPALRYANLLSGWLKYQITSDEMCLAQSGVVALPRLILIHVAQYFQYLDDRGMTHAEFLVEVEPLGGMQGMCGGLATAFALASAVEEMPLVSSISSSIRVAFAIGVYAEFSERLDVAEAGTVLVRSATANDILTLRDGFPQVSRDTCVPSTG